MPVLTVVDTSQIQGYIFRSNRLQENLGASYLVAQATGAWATEAARNAGMRCEIYAGGGNYMALFSSFDDARRFARALSLKVLSEAPELRLEIASCDCPDGEFQQKRTEVFRILAKQKAGGPRSLPPLGLGVTAVCRSTGLPAVDLGPSYEEDPEAVYRASSETIAKLSARQSAHGLLCKAVPPPDGYDYPSQFDHLGRSVDDHSFIAVVHADGNGMGKRIQDVGADCGNDHDRMQALRDFSHAVEAASRRALQDCVSALQSSVVDGRITHIVDDSEIASIELKEIDGNIMLPFRPIVFAGDDVTFVCDGRLGLSLALMYLRRFEEHTRNLPDGKGAATACAGVSIVKAHYPFARAYALAEELCRSAKDYRARVNHEREGEELGACIDWHFALGGMSGGLREIREREYKAAPGDLTLRPVAVGANEVHQHRSWIAVEAGIRCFQSEEWRSKRNKIKALRETLRLGADRVKAFCEGYLDSKHLPELPVAGTGEYLDTGWRDGRCMYFDAIELADWFVPLREEGQDELAVAGEVSV